SVEVNPNGNATSKVGDNRVDYEYDNSGRLIKTVINKFDQNLVTKNYYDSIGNVIKSVDPEGRMVQQFYHPRGWVVAEVDSLGRIVYHEYNELGKEIAVTDPRGVVEESNADFKGTDVEILGTTYRINLDYTTKVEYDSLARQIKATDLMGNMTEIQYNQVGAKLFVTQTPGEYDVNSNPRITEYIYTPQYWVETVITGNRKDLEHTISYEYDKVGNKTKEIYSDIKDQNAGSNYFTYEYDDLNRLEKVIRPDGSSEIYGYDEIGNQTSVINGRNFETIYYYNGLNQLSEVVEPTGSRTYYRYDPNGNLVQKELSNGLITDYVYNDLNLMVEEVRVRAQDVMNYKMAYDGSGNLLTSSDPRGNLTSISYYDNGSIKEQVFYAPVNEESVVIPDLTNVNVETVPIGYSENERISYLYDEVGNILEVQDAVGKVSYTYDRLSQITLETREIDQKTYTSVYEYDFAGNIVSIKYPESDELVEYQYNELNQLKKVEGYLDDLIYDPAGNLNEIHYSKNIITEITPDIMSRPERITVKSEKDSHYALDLNYAYDANGNVNLRNKNIYTYDELDRLKTAEVDGTFLVDAPGRNGYVANDYFVDSTLDYEIQDIKVDFDYAASTVGIQLESIQKVGRIELVPETFENRVSEHGIRIFYRQYTNEGYIELSPDQCVVNKSSTGRLIILLKSTVRAWEIKIHSNYDDRDIETGEIVNVAEFSNDLNKMVRVYGKYDRTKIEYDYDSVGNRTKETYTDLNYHYNVSYSYDYYDGSNRLKSRESQEVRDWISSTDNVDGFMKIGVGDKKGYQYDKAGNMVAKGNSYSFNSNSVDYSDKDGEDVLYWKYGYNAKNRLTDVWKKGEDEGSHISRYGYDYQGLRVRVEEADAVSYHVYNYFGQLIYEKQGDQETFYIYALGRVIAKREGKSGEEEKVYYYHHDNLGSTVLMTDGEGKIVFEQDYAPFGQDLHKAGTYEKPPYDVEAGMKYTGQIADVDTGLYYYNARYYDPEIGRFNREDEYRGDLFRPQSLNPYVYVLNNALKYVDPTGYRFVEIHPSETMNEDSEQKMKIIYSMTQERREELEQYYWFLEDWSHAINVPTLNWFADNAYVENSRDNWGKNTRITEEQIIKQLENYLSDPIFQVLLKKFPKDKRTHVIGFGLAGSYGKVVGAQDGLFVVLDDKGNIGLYNSLELGFYIGLGATGGPRILFSNNALEIYDLPGLAVMSFGFEVGFNKTVDYGYSVAFNGTTAHTSGYSYGSQGFGFVCTAMWNPSWLVFDGNVKDLDFYNFVIQPIFDVIQTEKVIVKYE
ncbi:MAG: hypothetical protein KAX49_19290, partial [Halanaerobiales bacterium]|nr:hypothetical protein [Halanaerobiales bacterium]